MSIRILTEKDPQGGHLGPFARIWARDAALVAAFAPGPRTSRDIAGRITLQLLPSGVFYPTVDNVIVGEIAPTLLAADQASVEAKGFGPVKLRQWHETTPLPLPGDALLEGFPEERYYKQAEEVCLVASAADIPADPRATCLALYDVEGDLPETGLPIVMYTKKNSPLKVILHEK